MNAARGGALVALVLVICSALAAQGKPLTVSLTVKHNGKVVPAPDHVALSFDHRSITMPVQNGRFQVPPEIVSAENVKFSAIADGEQIHTGMKGGKFEDDIWTLILEDRGFDDQFQPIPKGIRVRSSCILTFESETTEGTFLFDPHCRSRIGRQSKQK